MVRLGVKCMISWLGVCYFLSSTAVGAVFSVTVNHTTIGRDHTFELTARLEGNSDDFMLDTTPLTKSFYVTSERDMQRVGLWHEKRYRLGARRTGLLNVPALSVMFHGKKLVSQSFSVNALDTNSEVADVHLWVEDKLNRKHTWLRQQLVWQMIVLSTYPFASKPNIRLPSFNGFDVQKVDVGVPGEKVMKGRKLFTMTWYFLLFPKHGGDLLIMRPVISARLSQTVKTHRFAAGNPNFDAGKTLIHVKKAVGSEQHVQVRALPLAAVHLPVGHLTFTSGVPDTHIYAGEPMTWNIHLTSNGMRRSDIPDLWEHLSITGSFTVVREKPLVSVRRDGQKVNIDALYRMVITPSVPGELHLPAIDIPFFDPDHDRIAHASLASRTLQTLPSPNAQIDEGFEISPVKSSREHGSVSSTLIEWRGLAIGMFVLWLLTLVVWFFSSHISMSLRCLPLRHRRVRPSSLRRVLIARDADKQFSIIKEVLDMPERITPLGLLASFPDLSDQENGIVTWLEDLERGRWQQGVQPPLLDKEHVREMVRIIQECMQNEENVTSGGFKPSDFGRIGG